LCLTTSLNFIPMCQKFRTIYRCYSANFSTKFNQPGVSNKQSAVHFHPQSYTDSSCADVLLRRSAVTSSQKSPKRRSTSPVVVNGDDVSVPTTNGDVSSVSSTSSPHRDCDSPDSVKDHTKTPDPTATNTPKATMVTRSVNLCFRFGLFCVISRVSGARDCLSELVLYNVCSVAATFAFCP